MTRPIPQKFVDVEIVDVYTNSLRGKIVRTEAEMGLRIAESPESVIARTRKENDLGEKFIVGYSGRCDQSQFVADLSFDGPGDVHR